MIGKCNFNKIRQQAGFCNVLMSKLLDDINTSKEGSWSGMKNHMRKQDDIKRLRRELLELSKMLDPWGNGA